MFSVLFIFQISVVGDHLNWVPCSLEPVSPLLEGLLNGQQFFIAYVIVCLLKKKAQGNSFPGPPWHCDRTVPIPQLKVSTSTTKGTLGSGCLRMGAMVKLSFSLLKVALAVSVQCSLLSLSCRRVVMGQKQDCRPFSHCSYFTRVHFYSSWHSGISQERDSVPMEFALFCFHVELVLE